MSNFAVSRPTSVRRIAITGPESTGKSALCEQLARHFDTVFVPEYARYYIALLQRPYQADDLATIAYRQMALEDRYAQRYARNSYLLCDTDMTVIKIWHEHAFGAMPDCLVQLFEARRNNYAAYLLNDIDLPWQPDPQREHPHLRPFFFDWYHQLLQQNSVPFAVVSGTGEARIANALQSLANIGLI